MAARFGIFLKKVVSDGYYPIGRRGGGCEKLFLWQGRWKHEWYHRAIR